MRSTWKPIIVAVDGSPASANAAASAWALAELAGVACHLVHALPDAWEIPTEPHAAGMDPESLNAAAQDFARQMIETDLRDVLPPEALAHLEIRVGRPAAVIAEAVEEHDAELVVVGGKHHTALGRWLVGSTAHALLRTLDVPVLVTRELAVPVRRVLTAVDLSEAASPTVHAAERCAALFDAALRLVHVVTPPPAGLGIPAALFRQEATDRSREELARYVWPLTSYPGVSTTMRHGVAEAEVAAEAAAWEADLIVMGSHGKGWFDRVVIGSATERMLQALPTSLLIVPVLSGAGRTRRPRSRSGMAVVR